MNKYVGYSHDRISNKRIKSLFQFSAIFVWLLSISVFFVEINVTILSIYVLYFVGVFIMLKFYFDTLFRFNLKKIYMIVFCIPSVILLILFISLFKSILLGSIFVLIYLCLYRLCIKWYKYDKTKKENGKVKIAKNNLLMIFIGTYGGYKIKELDIFGNSFILILYILIILLFSLGMIAGVFIINEYENGKKENLVDDSSKLDYDK